MIALPTREPKSPSRWHLRRRRAGGFINLPAFVIALLVTWLLVIGTSESAKVNAVLVRSRWPR